ncbi:MAG: hypothetical protein EHM59_07245 [Betaproteobacteria bacterium]|nr:MAG: hypothetical protein EHM59_07245 [Betaproteobacteria bacterium]
MGVLIAALVGAPTPVWKRLINFAFAVLVASAPLHASRVFAAGATGAQTSENKAGESAPEKAAPLPSLVEILEAADRTDTLEREARKRFGDGARLKAATEDIDAAEEALVVAAKAVDASAPGRVQVLALIDLATEVRTHADKLRAITEQIGARVRAYDADLDRMNELDKDWVLRIETARLRRAPPELQKRLDAVPARLAGLAREVTRRRDANLAVLERASRVLGRLNAIVQDAGEQRERLLETLRTVRTEPLWRATPRREGTDYALAWTAAELDQVRTYVVNNAVTLGTVAVVAFVLGYLLMAGARAKLARDPRHDPETDLARMLFRSPLFSALFIALTAVVWRSPDAPVVYVGAMLTLIVVVTAFLVVTIIGHKAVLSLYVLAAALVLNWFQVGLDALPLSGRVALIVQCSAVAAALWLDLRRGRIANQVALLPPRLMAMVVRGSIALLMAAVVVDIVGYLGLARLLRDGVLRMLGLGLVLNLVGRLLYGLILVSLRSWVAQSSRIVQSRADSILSTAGLAIRGLAIAGWATGTLIAFRSVNFFDWLQGAVTDAKIEVGTVTLSLSAVLLCLAIVVATYYTVKAVRLLLEVEVLPRLSLTSASSFVVSATTRYLLTVAGLILAMAALGIDFSRVTLLVSAIGVGIGFGLQNVVNNFVSGLLLLGERVINVGDTVQVGSLTGVVNRIGVRSSTVRTFHGAEVIVPNSDLTSKEVVNFTLSDRHRRLDIAVGVGYGSDPDKVVQLLIDVAKSRPEVLSWPAPVAAFIGFGDSALDFRLQVWVANYEEGLQTETALRIAILARFKAEGIEIPFPQRDINIRSVTGSITPPAPL